MSTSTVALRAVRTNVVAAEVEAHSRRQVARLHLVVDALHVHMAPARRPEVAAGACELLLKARDVEAVGVEARKVAAIEEREDVGGGFGERGAVLDDVVRDAVDGRRLRRNRDRGIQQPSMSVLGSVRVQLDRRQLDDAVLPRIHARRFDVEHDERAVQFHLQFHHFLFPRISGAGGLLYTRECGGMDSISHTFPPISESWPITVSPPRIVAPA